MNLSLRQLKAFIGVAATGSFTKTSQRLHLTQAALSAMIRELEAQLGCRLFHRSTRTVTLTAAGQRFLPIATSTVASLEGAATDLAALGRLEESTLQVGVSPVVAQSLLPQVMQRFRQRAPQVTLSVSDCPPADLQRQTENGQLDAAFGTFFSKASGLEREPLATIHLMLVRRRDRRMHPPSQLAWDQLEGQTLITLPEGNPIQQLTEARLAELGIEPASRLRVNHMETLIAFAEQGLGVGVVPSFTKAACRRFDVQLAALTPPVEFQYHRMIRMGYPVSAALQTFTEVLTEVFAEHDRWAETI